MVIYGSCLCISRHSIQTIILHLWHMTSHAPCASWPPSGGKPLGSLYSTFLGHGGHHLHICLTHGFAFGLPLCSSGNQCPSSLISCLRGSCVVSSSQPLWGKGCPFTLPFTFILVTFGLWHFLLHFKCSSSCPMAFLLAVADSFGPTAFLILYSPLCLYVWLKTAWWFGLTH